MSSLQPVLANLSLSLIEFWQLVFLTKEPLIIYHHTSVMKWHAMQRRWGLDITQQHPMDPQSNGFAENFVKSVCKLVHAATVEGKDPSKEINTFLLQYCSTPHSTTGKSPAELLFGHKQKTKLPSTAAVLGVKTRQEIRAYHDTKKSEQKLYTDKRCRSKSKKIQPGDKILITVIRLFEDTHLLGLIF